MLNRRIKPLCLAGALAVAVCLPCWEPLWAQTAAVQTLAPPRVAAPGTNQPNPANLAPPDYVLGPGDQVAVTSFGAPEFDRTVTVGAQGNIELSYLSAPLAAGGETAAQLGTAIAAQMKARSLLIDPQIAVSVVSAQSHVVTVGGAVRDPTVIYLTRPISTLDALTRAGGPDLKAAGATVEITSASQTRTIPYTDITTGATPASNPMLDGGEHVSVRPGGEVFVVGAVKLPGAFPITADTPLTAVKAVALAQGWIDPGSNPSKAIIERISPTGKMEHIPVNLQRIVDLKAPDVPLQANDVLYIPTNTKLQVALFTAKSLVQTLGYAASLILAGR